MDATAAELLEVINDLPKGLVIAHPRLNLSRLALAFKLRDANAGTKFRLIFEDAKIQDIVRELY